MRMKRCHNRDAIEIQEGNDFTGVSPYPRPRFFPWSLVTGPFWGSPSPRFVPWSFPEGVPYSQPGGTSVPTGGEPQFKIGGYPTGTGVPPPRLGLGYSLAGTGTGVSLQDNREERVIAKQRAVRLLKLFGGQVSAILDIFLQKKVQFSVHHLAKPR